MLLGDNLIISKDNTWRFIGAVRQKNKSFEETIFIEVEKETNIKLDSVELLSSLPHKNGTRNLYHASLTDKHVNSMKRRDGQLLNFFTLQEARELPMGKLTRLFVLKHQDLLQKTQIFAN